MMQQDFLNKYMGDSDVIWLEWKFGTGKLEQQGWNRKDGTARLEHDGKLYIKEGHKLP